MTRKQIFIAIGFLALIAIGVGGWYLLSPSGGAATAPIASVPSFTITAQDHTQGNPKAPVVLIEYAALVCPHCAEFNAQNFPVLKSSYIDTGKVFYVFREFPIRPGDGPAEKLALCLPADQYFSFADLLFRNQPKWDVDEYPQADIHAGLLQMSRIAGMSSEQAEKCMSDTSMDSAINQVAQDATQKYNIDGTPTFIVDGVPGPAGEPWSGLQKRVDAAIASKKAVH